MVHSDDAPEPPTPRADRRSRKVLPAVAAGTALVLASAALVVGLGGDPGTDVGASATAAPSSTGSVASTSSAAPEPGANQPGATRPAAEPVAGQGGGALPAVAAPTWLTVDAARIDQPVVALTPTASDLADQSIVPPLTEDAYWLTNYGKPGEGSQNTTYITGHSWEDADAPFDRLSTDVAVGDTIVLGTATGSIDYVVESVTTHDKDTLKNSEIWNIVPNRLVLISCFTEDPWGKNVVVTAVPAARA